MGILQSVVGELGKKLEKTPGLAYVTALASSVLGIVFSSGAPESSWSLAFFAIVLSLLAYWVGGFLDNLLFEPIYGRRPENNPSTAFGRLVRRRIVEPVRVFALQGGLGEEMIRARDQATKRFHPTNQRGIYKTAKKLLSNTDVWDGRIKLWLDLSKAARTLVVPAIALLGWQLLAATTDLPIRGFPSKSEEMGWLGHPVSAISIAVISIILYVNLRLLHMRLLYNTLAAMPAFRFVVDVVEPRNDSRSPEVMWSVGERVISERELPVCRPTD